MNKGLEWSDSTGSHKRALCCSRFGSRPARNSRTPGKDNYITAAPVLWRDDQELA